MAIRTLGDRWFWIVLVLLIPASLLGSRFITSAHFEYIDITPSFYGVAQKQTKRVWRPTSWSHTETPFVKAGFLKDPFSLRVDFQGDLYVMDLGDFSVKKISDKGTVDKIFGGEALRASKRMATLTDFAVTRAGQVLLLDPPKRQTLVFDQNGHLVFSHASIRSPYRALIDSRDHLWTLSLDEVDKAFSVRSLTESKVRNFGSVLKDQKAYTLALDGWLVGDARGGIVYAPSYAGYLIAFDANGHRRFAVETIEPRSYPKIVRNAQGTEWIDRQAVMATAGAQSSGHDVYLLNKIGHVGAQRNIFDVYDADDGSYKYSLDAPHSCRAFALSDEYLFALSGNDIFRWPFHSSGRNPT